MCGIAGVYHKDRTPLLKEIQTMMGTMIHRGPDGDGFIIEKNVALGHRRLSIIDLDMGKQPMCNEDESVWITFNGEIYNYKALRKSLIKLGHVFKTSSDTECIIHGYEEWGIGILNKLRGMFAFCILDLKKDNLFLARDQFGIKPLIYRHEEDSFTFSSELNALRSIEKKSPEGDIDALIEYLRLGYIPAPKTIYKNIHKLPAAHYLIFDTQKNEVNIHQYWDLKFKKSNSNNKDWLQEANEIIDDSVKAHLVADVPYGVFLSGGIDSSLMSLKAAEISANQELQAFSIGFKEEDYNELKYAKQAAKKIGIKLHYEIITDTGLDLLPTLINDHYGEPFADSSCIPTYLVAKLARNEVPMVLSGDGGDELFGGYPTYQSYLNGGFNAVLNKKMALQEFMSMPRFILGSGKQYIANGFSENKIEDWLSIMAHRDEDFYKALLPSYQHKMNSDISVFSDAHKKASKLERLAYAQYVDIKSYLPYDICTKVDIASMANGLEVRPPLLDIRIAEFIATIPIAQKFGMVDGQKELKLLLKKILNQHFPKEFVYRKKKGFSIPTNEWIGNSSVFEHVKSVILDESTRLSQIFNMDQLKLLLKTQGTKNNSTVFLRIYILGLWMQNKPAINFH